MYRTLLAILLTLAALVAVGWPPRARIDRPALGLPAETTQGALEATLSLPFCPPEDLKRRMVTKGFKDVAWTWQGLRARRSITAPALKPKDPSGLWKVVHIADLPPPGRDDLLKAFLAQMVGVRPDFILATGDLGYGDSAADWDRIEGFFRDLEAMGIPVVSCPGNHERKAWIQYLRHFGPITWHRVEIGPFTILSLDSEHGRDQLTPAQFGWFQRELEATRGRTVLVQLHHPLFKSDAASQGEAKGSGGILGAKRDEFIRLCQLNGVAAVLSGHWHSDAVFDVRGRLRNDTCDFGGTKFIVTTTLGNDTRKVTRWPLAYHGYRVLTFREGALLSYTADLDGDGQPDPIASEPLLPIAPLKAGGH